MCVGRDPDGNAVEIVEPKGDAKPVRDGAYWEG
jgi:hypothetical protein